MRKVMGHTAVSATQASSVTHKKWQHGATYNYCTFTTFKMEVNTKTSVIQMGPNVLTLLENEAKPIINFGFLRIPSPISKDQKENIIGPIF